jgi:hypothetical protein
LQVVLGSRRLVCRELPVSTDRQRGLRGRDRRASEPCGHRGRPRAPSGRRTAAVVEVYDDADGREGDVQATLVIDDEPDELT